jgi:hypothetical protein
MTSRLRRLLALAFVACVAPGCVSNEVSFFIQQNQVPVPGGIGTTCMFSADPMSLHRSEGVLDLTLANSYTLFALYRNEMFSSETRIRNSPELRGLFVDGANVEIHADTATGPLIAIHDSTGAAVAPTFTISTNAFVDAATAAGPGYNVGTLDIIPINVGQAMFQSYCIDGIWGPGTPDPQIPGNTTCPVPHWPTTQKRVVVVVRPFGHTMGENAISGSVFPYPVTVCCRCLVQFMAGVTEPSNPSPNCLGNNTGTLTAPCNIGQDDPVDCRLCATTNIQVCEPRGYQPNLPASQMPTCPVI